MPGLEQVLDHCFAIDERIGIIAMDLARLFTCFPEESRRRSFLDLVDALYNIKDMKIFTLFFGMLFNKGRDQDEICLIV